MTKNVALSYLVAMAASTLLCATASAQEQSGSPNFTVHDRVRGEISPGAAAPTRATLMAAIDSSSPAALSALLEYGERVECHECVPLLERRMLDPRTDRLTRESAAWWLRRRLFGFAAIFRDTRMILANDSDPARRAVAAEALGDFMDPHGVEFLAEAIRTDTDTRVRVAAIHGMARLNNIRGTAVLAEALADNSSEVQLAVLQEVQHVNFFSAPEEVLPLLGSDDAAVRRQAALVVGTLGVDMAVIPLSAMLRGDVDVMARQAAAWALGRIARSHPEAAASARTTLAEVQGTETVRAVRDAIEVALRMR